MKLSQCTYGVLVQLDNNSNRVGMVVGITNSAGFSDGVVRDKLENAVPLIKWSGRTEPVGVHHANLSIFKG